MSNGNSTTSPEFSIIQWNCHGIKNKPLAKDILLKTDIVILQETFLKPNDQYYLPGKTIYRLDRRDSHGGGLLIGINSKIQSQISTPTFPPAEAECLAINFFHDNIQFSIFNIYSRRGNFDDSWLFALQRTLKPPCLILGDFNIHHPALGSQKTSRSANKVLDWISNTNNCILNTSQPTFFKLGCIPSLLDLSISSPDLFLNSSCAVLNDNFDSDHSPILIKIPIKSINKPKPRTRIHWDNFSRDLNSELSKSADTTSICHLENSCISILKANTKFQQFPPKKFPPWWTSKCSYLLGLKRKLLRQAKRSVVGPTWLQAKGVAARLRKLTKQLRRDFWNNLCAKTGSTSTAFRILKSLRNRDVPSQITNKIIIPVAASH